MSSHRMRGATTRIRAVTGARKITLCGSQRMSPDRSVETPGNEMAVVVQA